MSLRKTIRAYYSAPIEVAFRQFRAGLIFFATGFGAILMANAYMEPSVQQEFIVLGGMILGSYGFILALLGQSRVLVGRLMRFWSKEDK
jgi:hypothetical protein